jgi:hypothetical protein
MLKESNDPNHDFEPFYRAAQGREPVTLFAEQEVKGTPIKTAMELDSNGASSVLNPWFGIEPSAIVKFRQKDEEARKVTDTLMTTMS